MMEISDIHTHVLPRIPGSAIVSIGCGPLPQESGHLFSAGLHPWDVTGDDDDKFIVLKELLSLPEVLAVGECGFDRLRGPSHELQEEAFIKQCLLSEQYGKPMILHAVRDTDSVLRLKKELKPKQGWLIHGFRGGPEQMEQLLRNGILVSFGLKSNEDALRQVPPGLLFLETDGKADISEVICNASLIRKEPQEAVARNIIENNLKFLNNIWPVR